VGNEKKHKTDKWFTFSKYYNFFSFFSYYKNIAKLSSQLDFNRLEVISKYCREYRKVVFDINAKDISEEE